MPREDERIMPFFRRRCRNSETPQNSSDVVSRLTKDSEYAAVFIPEGMVP